MAETTDGRRECHAICEADRLAREADIEWDHLVYAATDRGERPTVEKLMALHAALNKIADLSAGRES